MSWLPLPSWFAGGPISLTVTLHTVYNLVIHLMKNDHYNITKKKFLLTWMTEETSEVLSE